MRLQERRPEPSGGEPRLGQSAGDCAGTCYGAEALCFEAAGRSTIQTLQFVGAGKGAFIPVSAYNFVGQGNGDYEKEPPAPKYLYDRVRWQCWATLGALVLAAVFLPFVVWLFMGMREDPSGSLARQVQANNLPSLTDQRVPNIKLRGAHPPPQQKPHEDPGSDPLPEGPEPGPADEGPLAAGTPVKFALPAAGGASQESGTEVKDPHTLDAVAGNDPLDGPRPTQQPRVPPPVAGTHRDPLEGAPPQLAPTVLPARPELPTPGSHLDPLAGAPPNLAPTVPPARPGSPLGSPQDPLAGAPPELAPTVLPVHQGGHHHHRRQPVPPRLAAPGVVVAAAGPPASSPGPGQPALHATPLNSPSQTPSGSPPVTSVPRQPTPPTVRPQHRPAVAVTTARPLPGGATHRPLRRPQQRPTPSVAISAMGRGQQERPLATPHPAALLSKGGPPQSLPPTGHSEHNAAAPLSPAAPLPSASKSRGAPHGARSPRLPQDAGPPPILTPVAPPVTQLPPKQAGAGHVEHAAVVAKG